MYKRFFKEPQDSFFLFGPRGTGKTTLIQTNQPNAIWIDLLKADIHRLYTNYPERLYQLLIDNKEPNVVVIDEVQKAPALLAVVHSLIEEKLGIQFILTGSSSRKLKRTGADLLGGRAVKRMLHPFMAAEMGNDYDFESSLNIGLLPVVLAAKNPQDALDAYVSIYLQEEIQAEGLVRNLENFSRFLEVISFSHASILNITNIGRECGVKRKSVENYLNILEELLLAFQLPVFTKKAQREMSQHPKFYLFDTGVYRTLRPKGPFDRVEEIEGAALEGLIAQHLVAWSDYSKEKWELSFWRTRSGNEVDFVIYGEKGLWAIEVKNTINIHAGDLKGLEAFCQDYPIAKPLLLYRGKDRLQIKGITCLPCEEFLRNLRPDNLFYTESTSRFGF